MCINISNVQYICVFRDYFNVYAGKNYSIYTCKKVHFINGNMMLNNNDVLSPVYMPHASQFNFFPLDALQRM